MNCECPYCDVLTTCESCGEPLDHAYGSMYCGKCRDTNYDHAEALHRHEETE